MNNFQRQAILRCKGCNHEWKVHIRSGQLYPCPKCEGFKSG
jgi:Zn finger protein HypA/HybF involved in hydrogenase expression